MSGKPPTKELQPVTGEQFFHKKHVAAYNKKFDVRCAFDFVANAFHHVSCKVHLVNFKLNLFKPRPAIGHFEFAMKDLQFVFFCFLRLSLLLFVDCLVKKVLDGLLFTASFSQTNTERRTKTALDQTGLETELCYRHISTEARLIAMMVAFKSRAPLILSNLPKFCVAQRNLFQTYIKTNLSPLKIYFPPEPVQWSQHTQ